MAYELSSTEAFSLLSLTVACSGIITNILLYRPDGAPLIACLALSGIAFSVSYALIRWTGPAFIKVGLKGSDMSKVNKKELPEAMGLVSFCVYLVTLILFLPFVFQKDWVAATSGGGNRDVVMESRIVEIGRLLHRFPHSKLAAFLSALLSLSLVGLLGFLDDLFNLRWRYKFPLPAVAAVPLLVVYAVDFGVTHIVVPKQLQPYVGSLLDLGDLYYIYMAAIAIFLPNSINILAGINGLEVSQSIVIALLIVLNDCLYLLGPYPHPATDSHLFSLYMLLPLIGVSLALLWHNWFPARVFVGDTYCYFAGMVFAIVGILGHFSKTLLLLFIPQIFNFLYSVPQLFKIIPCPRHRLPKFNARTGLLSPSVTEWESPPKTHLALLLKTLHSLRLLQVTTDAKGVIKESSNFTVLNLWLVWFGPKREDRLAIEILAMQLACGLVGLFVRHRLALWVFDADNLSV